MPIIRTIANAFHVGTTREASISSIREENEMYIPTIKKKKLFRLIDEINPLFTNVVKCQSILETGDYHSNIAKSNKNYFGMKHNSRGLSVGAMNGHAKYTTDSASVADYKRWQAFRIKEYERYYKIKVTNEEQYLHFLDHVVIGKSV